MKKQLCIGTANGKPFNLPLDFVTSTSVIYGGKGMGKTNLASVLAEELDAAGERFAYLDPLGVTWGLRHSTGKGTAGLEILILGGIHGGIPIEPGAGAIVADLVVDEKVSVVIDISRNVNGKMWSKGEKIRFVADYTTRLFERMGEKRRRLLQIYDEAARFIPQIIPHGSPELSRCVGAIEQATEEGRNVGLGVCFITQRSARMNKSVSELADCMIAFRTIGPNSMEAVLDWLGDHLPKSVWANYQNAIRSLPVGSALVVSPGWIKHEGIVQVRARRTFDSSATPKAGARRSRPGAAKKIDLSVYRERMAATIEKAKADNPIELRKEIAELRKRLEAIKPMSKTKEIIKTVKVPMLTDAQIKRLEKVAHKFGEAMNKNRQLIDTAAGIAACLTNPMKMVVPPQTVTVDGIKPKALEIKRASVTASKPERVINVISGDDQSLSKSGRKILDAMAQLEVIGMATPHRSVVAAHCGVPPTSGGYSNNLWKLKEAGYVIYPGPSLVKLTDIGRAIAATPTRAPTLALYHEHWKSLLSKAQQKLLGFILDAYPQQLGREQLAEAAGVPSTSGGYSNDLWRMKALGCIEYPQKGYVVATKIMFPEELP